MIIYLTRHLMIKDYALGITADLEFADLVEL